MRGRERIACQSDRIAQRDHYITIGSSLTGLLVLQLVLRIYYRKHQALLSLCWLSCSNENVRSANRATPGITFSGILSWIKMYLYAIV